MITATVTVTNITKKIDGWWAPGSSPVDSRRRVARHGCGGHGGDHSDHGGHDGSVLARRLVVCLGT